MCAKKAKPQRTVLVKLLAMGLIGMVEILGSVNLILGAKDVPQGCLGKQSVHHLHVICPCVSSHTWWMSEHLPHLQHSQ